MTTELARPATEHERPSRWRASIEEFWSLPESNLPCEYINGEIIMAPTPTVPHQRAVGEIFVTLRNHVRKNASGEVFVSPLDVELPSGDVAQPDVFFLPSEDAARFASEKRLRGVAPALAVEVLSPGSIKHDRQTKRRLYEKNGVREYWMVDLKAKTLAQLVLVEGRYESKELAEEDVVKSVVLEGFETEVGALLGLV